MTKTNNAILTIDIHENKLIIVEDEIMELWTGVEIQRSKYEKVLNDIKDRINFLTPKGGNNEG